jgi:hypothetical protein
MTNIGNINYSLDKNDFYKIITGSVSYFIPYYYVLTFILLIYLYTIRFKKYIFSDRNKNYQLEEDTIHFFKSITYNSPFGILQLLEKKKDEDGYVGLTNTSYIYLVISYVISYIIILEGLIRNFIYNVYASVIQANSNNNPYNNFNCINKTNINSVLDVSGNYWAIISLSLIFLVPFLIPFAISFFKFDNYDIKHSSWFQYLILYLIFFPIIMMFLSKVAFYKKLEIFNGLNKYIQPKDNSFIDYIRNNFNFKMNTVLLFLFIIFIYTIYTLIYADFNFDIKHRTIAYILIFIVLFVFIPIFIVFFTISIIFNNKYDGNFNGDVIKNIQEKGVSSLYDLLVKYNYPCFIK